MPQDLLRMKLFELTQAAAAAEEAAALMAQNEELQQQQQQQLVVQAAAGSSNNNVRLVGVGTSPPVRLLASAGWALGVPVTTPLRVRVALWGVTPAWW